MGTPGSEDDSSGDVIPIEARRNEFAGLTERQLSLIEERAIEQGDWQTLSKLEVANQPSGEVPQGMTLKVQSDFIDRR